MDMTNNPKIPDAPKAPRGLVTHRALNETFDARDKVLTDNYAAFQKEVVERTVANEKRIRQMVRMVEAAAALAQASHLLQPTTEGTEVVWQVERQGMWHDSTPELAEDQWRRGHDVQRKTIRTEVFRPEPERAEQALEIVREITDGNDDA